MPVEIIVALIAGGFGVLIELIRRLLKQNTKDHETVIGSLNGLSEKVDGIKDDVSDLKGEHRWLREKFFNHVTDTD
jgi:nickel-dependent lactate racemase